MPEPTAIAAVAPVMHPQKRPRIHGKFVFVGDKKLYIRGVTYGTFRPGEDGAEYHPETVERDFALMAASGLNAVRTYTVPPRWLLDAAHRHGLYAMVGLPWVQHVAFLDDKRLQRDAEEQVRLGVRACAGHPAVLCYAIGNEIPAPVVRWHGYRRVERFLDRLCQAAKAEDPGGLVTYANYPSTEYLRLSSIDFVTFNVYIESPEPFEGYLARLQNIAGDRPLVMGEIGLDSRRNGEDTQAEVLGWQIGATFAGGCAGAFVFAWTDEWHRGGQDIEDWAFGLTDRERRPKPALRAAGEAFGAVPFPPDLPWPRVSVVVCSYNGGRTIRDCLEGLRALRYPEHEVIVVDDGSTDATASIAGEYAVRLIRTANRGLSAARNAGLAAATGEIVAYLDDDARPDPHWLTYLAATFLDTDHAGVGGPNLAPADAGAIATCVAAAPGGPIHVLLSDQEAEHIPGCNMAFRRDRLMAIGGFDPQYRAAGDDVDLCWRLRERGWTLGFSPAAVVWHHRRDSVRAYWKQQLGYGKAEAVLERKWPERYNPGGHLSWAGWVYGEGLAKALRGNEGRIHHGVWGSALFQSVYQPAADGLWSLPLMPEWYLVVAALAAIACLGALWMPLFLALPLLALAVGAQLAQAGLNAAHAPLADPARSRGTVLAMRVVTAYLHLLQPLARLCGRMRNGLTPWRRWRRGVGGAASPLPRTIAIWQEGWRSPQEWLSRLERLLREDGAAVDRGGAFARWDLQVRGGLMGGARLLLLAEEHEAGRQLARFRAWPRVSAPGSAVVLSCIVLAGGAAAAAEQVVGAILGAVAVLLALGVALECALALASVRRALGRLEARAGDYPPGRGAVRVEPPPSRAAARGRVTAARASCHATQGRAAQHPGPDAGAPDWIANERANKGGIAP